ncbi:MAG: thiol peroxidase [Chloroflexota bacterium]|nr:thiol peroxidase [Chloroflexota bacterium]
MNERTGEAFELGEQLTVVGRKLESGEKAPDFELEHLDPVDASMRTVHLGESAGKVRLLNVVNSLDTPICHVETHQWDKLRASLPPDVVIYTVSMDLPFAQARWHNAEGVEHSSLSAHKSEQFGEDYGVLIKEWRLLQRAVFVVDRDGNIAYAEYVPDQMREPDYDAAVQAALQVSEQTAGK